MPVNTCPRWIHVQYSTCLLKKAKFNYLINNTIITPHITTESKLLLEIRTYRLHAYKAESSGTTARSDTRTHTHAHMNASTHNSYLPVIGVHEMHGRMHPNYWQITILLVVGPLFIIGLLYDDPTPSHSRQIAYKNFATTNKCTYVHVCGNEREDIYILVVHNAVLCTAST